MYYVIGDIHGQYDMLISLMAKIEKEIDYEKDQLIFIGDYIDRGPDSNKVISYIISLVSKYPNSVIPLMGNHEEMFNNYMMGIDEGVFIYNGGYQTIKSYNHKIPDEHIEFIKNKLKKFYVTENYFFIHGGINMVKNPNPKFEDLDLEEIVTTIDPSAEKPFYTEILWIRDLFLYKDFSNFGKTIVFGHTPFFEGKYISDIYVKYGKIGIDTGAAYLDMGGKLSCIVLPSMKVIQIEKIANELELLKEMKEKYEG